MELLDKLGVNPVLLIGYFVNFLILFFVLNKFVFKKVIANMEQRQKMTADLVNNAKSAESTLSSAKKEFDEIVSKANEQAMAIIGKADTNAKVVAEEVKHKAESQAQEILKRAEENIAIEHTNLKTELEKEIGILIIDAVEKVIGDLPSEQKDKVMKNIDSKFGSK